MAIRTIKSISNDAKRVLDKEQTLSVSTVLEASDTGASYNISTDSLVVTLPLIETEFLGMSLRFRNTGADGNNIITLSPNAADGVNGSIANAASDSVGSGVVNKDIVNTKVTANQGDYIEIKAVSLTKWFIVGGVGIWASEA